MFYTCKIGFICGYNRKIITTNWYYNYSINKFCQQIWRDCFNTLASAIRCIQFTLQSLTQPQEFKEDMNCRHPLVLVHILGGWLVGDHGSHFWIDKWPSLVQLFRGRLVAHTCGTRQVAKVLHTQVWYMLLSYRQCFPSTLFTGPGKSQQVYPIIQWLSLWSV